MNNYVVTIARGFGSGGKAVAMGLVEELGIECDEHRILALASQYSGYEEDRLSEFDEKINGSVLMIFVEGYAECSERLYRSTERVLQKTYYGSKRGGRSAGSEQTSAKEQDILVIQDSDWEGIDLFQVSSWNDMQSLIADTVLGTDPETKEATPCIASESVWSEDGLTWTLTFPEGMYYSTGEQLEPEER